MRSGRCVSVLPLACCALARVRQEKKRSRTKHAVDTMDSAAGHRRSYDPRKDSLVQKIKAIASSRTKLRTG